MNHLIFDVETTSLSHELGALVQLAAIPVINGIKGEPFVSYCKPHKDALIDPKALEINKLTYEQLQTFPDAQEVIPKFIEWVDSQQTLMALLGHNISFDRKFLYTWMCRHGYYGSYITRFRPQDYCTLKMAREAFKGKRIKPEKMNLGSLCKFFKVDLINAHDALADIEATYEVYQHLKAMLPESTVKKPIMNYADKRRKYLDTKYIMFNPDGAIYINDCATKDPEAARFIAEEIYHLFGA